MPVTFVQRLRRGPALEVGALLALVGATVGLALADGGVPRAVHAIGIVNAAVLALHGIGVVLVYRSNRFIDFAQLQFGAVGAALFATIVQGRPLLRLGESLCPPCFVRVTPTMHHVNYGIALVLGLGLSVFLAWLMYVAVVRRFANASRLAVTVASIFVVQILASVQQWLPDQFLTDDQRAQDVVSGAVTPPVAARIVWFGVRLHLPDVVLVGLAVVAALAIGTYLRRSATGTAIRAAAENSERAQSLGINVGRVTARVWVLVGLLSGSAAILGAMTEGADAVATGLNASVLIRLLAVAIVARLVSLPLAALAALVLGLLDAVVGWTATPAALDGGLVVIVAVLLLVQRRQASRADLDQLGSWRASREARPIPRELRGLPSVRSWLRTGAVVGAVVVLGAPWVLSPGQNNAAAVAMMYAIVGLSLLVLTGWAGQVSLGQFAFAAVGAYVTAVTGLPFLLALPVGALAGAVVAVLVGLPALKLRGHHLAISTLAFALAVTAVLLNPRYLGRHLPSTIDRPALLGMSFDDQRVSYYVVLAVLAVSTAAVAGLRRSRTGRALIAARDNEAAAQSLGIGLVRARIGAFAVSGFLAALAGSLFAFHQGAVQAEAFDPERSIVIFVFTVIGGFGSLAGPLLGFVFYAVITVLSKSPLLVALAGGGGGLILLLLAPGGLAQVVFDVRDGMLRRLAHRHRIVVPSLVADRRDADEGRAPIAPKQRPGGGAVFVPVRYGLDDQWAIAPSVDRDGQGAEHARV